MEKGKGKKKKTKIRNGTSTNGYTNFKKFFVRLDG